MPLCEYCNLDFKTTRRARRFCTPKCASKNAHVRSTKERTGLRKHLDLKTEVLRSKTKNQLFIERSSWQSARSAIQKNARATYKASTKAQYCAKCGYATFFDVAHIRDVSQFPGEARVSEINDISNLIALCPNHHLEFDKGLLLWEDIIAGME